MVTDKYLPKPKLIGELTDPELVLITDSQEVKIIAENYSLEIIRYPCLWVKVLDGEIREIWGSLNSIPWISQAAYPLMVDGLVTDWC